jgi:hypothetical protein
MLWALISSAYVIYLYRKLNDARQPEAPTPASGPIMSALDAELAELDDRIGRLESRLPNS